MRLLRNEIYKVLKPTLKHRDKNKDDFRLCHKYDGRDIDYYKEFHDKVKSMMSWWLIRRGIKRLTELALIRRGLCLQDWNLLRARLLPRHLPVYARTPVCVTLNHLKRVRYLFFLVAYVVLKITR